MTKEKLFELYCEKVEWFDDVLSDEEKTALWALIARGEFDQKHFLRSMAHDVLERLAEEVKDQQGFVTYWHKGDQVVRMELDLSL